MSSKPNPVALTACMLMEAQEDTAQQHQKPVHYVANLASAIHRLAPACKRLALAECNGEWHDGQRAACYSLRDGYESRAAALAKSITDYATRLDKRIVKLNTELAPFGYQLIRQGDPRGATSVMAETPVDDSTTHYAIG